MSARTQLRMLGAIVASVLALLAAVAGPPVRAASSAGARGSLDVAALAGEIEREADHVTAVELAEWIRAGKVRLHLLDVRADSEFAAYHIPSAESVRLGTIASRVPEPGETLVLYSEGGAHAAQAWVLLRATGHHDVYFLRGGLLEWIDEIMNPVVTGDPASAHVAALSRYFGGVPRAAEAGAVPRLPTVRGSAAANGAIARVRRRGC